MTNAEKTAVFVLNDMEEKNRKSTQNQRILAHLFANGAITPMDALRQYGVMRLGARIYDLKKMGVPIVREMVYDDGVGYARYRLEDDDAGL